MSGSKKSTKKTNGNDKVALPIANLESHPWYEALLKNEVTTFNSLVSIHVHSKRKRLVDADSVSAKAAIDGLVLAGLLQDDSPKYVEKVSYSQEQGDEEETIITVREV